jgi:archaellum biogenesis ATPase FlaH
MLIDRIWAQQDGQYFFLASKSASGKFREHVFKRSEIKDIGAFCKENADKDIYFCPHGFSKPTRKKEFAVLPKMLWADLDEVDPHDCDPKPTIAIESSPGRFVGLWFTDKVISESLNRRLTYHLGADHGGWDLTQVLRVPGTSNYKYSSTPRVRILWDDGPSWKIRAIEKLLPDEPDGDVDISAQEIFDKYEKMLPAWARRELMTAKTPASGKRSEMIWKLEHALLEAGLSKDEAFVMIKASVWNKFKGRNSEDAQLRRELDKVVHERMKSDTKTPIKHKYLAHSMAEVEQEEIDWIWYPILARGEITIIEGDPGLGKSYLTQMVSKAICDGDKLPRFIRDNHIETIQGKVAYFDMENSAGTVTKKRLLNNNLQNQSAFYQEEEPFSWADADRMSQVYEALERIKPTLVVFDTMNTYLGGAVDTGRANSSQEAMFPLREIANRFNCAVAVIRHLVKSKKDKSALHAGQGSIAFAGFVRIVATVGRLPDDPDVGAIAVTKCNLGPQIRDVLTFEIAKLPDLKNEKDRSRFKWGELVKNVGADDIIQNPEKNSDKGEAEEFLRDVLDDGEEDIKKIEVMAEKRGISRRTLQRAGEGLGVTKKVKGFGKNKVSYWSL